MKFEVKSYDYECGDGCCSMWGANLYKDGEFVQSFLCSEEALQHIIQTLGHEIEIGEEK